MRAALALSSLLAVCLFAACGGSGGGSGPDGAVTDDPCSGDETRCVGSSYQVCGSGGTFVEEESCEVGEVCATGLGCAECRPSDGTVCVDDNVHDCSADGTVGDRVTACQEGCSNGTCGGDCDTAGVELIYVVDEAYDLWSFDPTKIGGADDPFTHIGSLDCPAGESWPDWGGGNPATPFSMSVDRDAQAWVLYTSGEIFHVSTRDASCQATDFQRGQMGFELFGMGFVSDDPGGDEETLFISGGSAAQDEVGNLGSVDPETRQVSTVGSLPDTEFGPELTGTGDAELYGYYPGTSESFVGLMSKGDASIQQQWDLARLSGNVRAWAFAHYGGRFYIFITTQELSDTSRVLELDPEANGGAGMETEKLSTSDGDHVPVIVGAGVSTCAPVVIP